MLGIGLAFLFERLNRRLRDPEEAREAYGWPVLGTVPESKAIAVSNEGTGAVAELPFLENESFHTMRAALRYFTVDSELRRVLVTSYTGGRQEHRRLEPGAGGGDLLQGGDRGASCSRARR